jgi:hypothetical protein
MSEPDDGPAPEHSAKPAVGAASGDEQATGAAPAGPTPPRAPSVSAAARARRIGGRVGPRPSPGTIGDPADTAADTASEEAIAPGAAAPPAAADRPVTLSKREPAAGDGDDVAAPTSVAVVPAWLRWLPAELLTAGAVAMAILMIVFSHGVWWGRPDGNTVREEMLAAAKTCVAKTNTYKYTDLPKYSAAVKQCTTGRLTGQINRTISTVIKKYAPTLKATQTAQISRGAIEAVSPHGKQWTVLVFGQLSVVNSNDPKGRTDPFAAQVKMEKVHGKWLMSGLTTVATPVG